MALEPRTERHLLPCGRDLEDLWEHNAALADSRLDEHERTCAHCQSARSSLQALAAATRAVYEDESLSPPRALRGRIMDAVRAEVRRVDRLPLPPGEFGPVEVSEQAAAVVLRFAADTVEGIRARHCRLRAAEPPSVRVADSAARQDRGAGPIWVDLSIAIRYSQHTTLALLDAVRTRVAAAAAAQVGLNVTRIDIEVEDLYHDRGDRQP